MSATATRDQQQAKTPALECREFPFHAVYEGTAQQLLEAGVLPPGYKFPKRSKDVEFIAENGFLYSVAELWEPRGVYEVSIGLPQMADLKPAAEKLAAKLLDLCKTLPAPARMGALMSAILTGFNALPGAPLRLADVRGDSDDLESLRFDIDGPRVCRGTRCYSVAAVMEYYLLEDWLATGKIKKPAGYLHTLPSPVAAPAPRPAPRRTVARLLAAV